MADLNAAHLLPGVEARPGSGHYGVFDHGAQVWSWQPDGQAPVLWLSSTATFAPGEAVRGGIPICFPWFGAGASGDKTPAHGFVRTATWTRIDTGELTDSGELEVRYAIDESITGGQPLFPHDYAAELRVRFGADHLQTELRVSNTGAESFSFEEALHTYLAVSDVAGITIDGLDGSRYLDKVAGDNLFNRVQDGPLKLTGPTDRVFMHAEPVTVTDPGYARTLQLTTEGAANVVIWNPWQAGAEKMADMAGDEWRQMVCVEAANAYADTITLLPGEHWTMAQRIELINGTPSES